MAVLFRQVIITICFASLALSEIVKPDLPSSDTNELDSDASVACSSDESKDPYYIPHWKDCSKFFICDHGILHLRSCQPKLHFNPTLKACDYPEVAGCDKGPTNKLKGKMIGDMSCPATNPKYPVLLPDPEDCSRFYICNSGLRHPQNCQSGLHFNPKISACDYPKSAGCDKGVEEVKPKGKIAGDFDLCPAENPKHPVLLPHPEDCSKFYVCDSGIPHLKNCQSGLHFNPKIKACDFPGNAGCDTESEEEGKDETTGDDLDLCPAENSKYPVLLPHPEDCNKFYICNSGTANLKECQSGLHFNPKIKACDFPQNAGCEKGNLVKPKGKMTGDDFDLCPAENSKYPVFLPHPEDCNKFYICNSGTAHLKQCQPGLHFNPEIKACDYPNRAGCDKGETLMMAGVPSPYCPPRDGKTPVFFRHSTNCSVYYMCGNGLAYEFACPSRLHFNLRKKVCDYEDKSGCRNYDF